MITVIGIWEPTWFEYAKTERRVWKQTIDSFNVDVWCMYVDPEEMERDEKPWTFLVAPRSCDENAIPLTEFEHPKDAVYVFGNTPNHLKRYIREGDQVVTIPVPNPNASMFGHCALPVVLYDRMIKSVN